jgi:hypothetical protein
MRSVQELVGHHDLMMTQRYSHLSPGRVDRHRAIAGGPGWSQRRERNNFQTAPLSGG